MMASLVAGCGAIRPSTMGAKAQSMSSDVVAVAVDLRAVPHETPASHFNANGVTFDINRDHFSEDLVVLLRESLEGAGGVSAGPRTIGVRVDYVDFMFQGPCLIDFRVVLGDQSPFGLQTVGESTNFSYACRSAIEAAVPAVFDDPRTVHYLRGE